MRLCSYVICLVAVLSPLPAVSQDVPGSTDLPGMKRYEGSALIGYRPPRFEEFVLPLGPPTQQVPPAYEKSQPLEGLVSRYTYLAPQERTPAEVFRNYRQEFARLGLQTLYEKGADARGWFGPTFQTIASEDDLGQILFYNEAQERVLVARSKDAAPTHYYLFVTAFRDGVVPERLQESVTKERALAHLVVIAPEKMEERMAFVNAGEMSRSLSDAGRVALYGIHFDTDSDAIRAESLPTLQEIAKLLAAEPSLRLSVVGHTDGQGGAAHNLDLSRRRAESVVRELTTKLGVSRERLDSFGAARPHMPPAKRSPALRGA